jgi:L-iditol 2-dehydrogenase
MGTPIQTLPISAAALREVDLVGVFRYADTYSKGVDIISNREAEDPDYGALVTHTFKRLDNAEKAFDMAGRTMDEEGRLVIKVVLEMGDEEEEDDGEGGGGERKANL